jgi:hypothetical protein
MQIVLSRKTADQRTVYYTIDDRQRTLFHQYALTLRWGSSICYPAPQLTRVGNGTDPPPRQAN